MKEFKLRQIIGIGIALSLSLLNFGFVIVSIPILIIVMIDYSFNKPKKEIEEEVPIETDSSEIEVIRALSEKVDLERNKWIEYRRNVDVRQFKGRKDVTVEEVEDYLWYHKAWEGHHEKWIILDEIMKVCNLNEDDCKEIMIEHYNHKGNDDEIGSGCWIRNEEQKKIQEYENKKYLRERNEVDKNIERMNQQVLQMCPQAKNILTRSKRKNDDRFRYINDYDNWLKERGYGC